VGWGPSTSKRSKKNTRGTQTTKRPRPEKERDERFMSQWARDHIFPEQVGGKKDHLWGRGEYGFTVKREISLGGNG